MWLRHWEKKVKIWIKNKWQQNQPHDTAGQHTGRGNNDGGQIQFLGSYVTSEGDSETDIREREGKFFFYFSQKPKFASKLNSWLRRCLICLFRRCRKHPLYNQQKLQIQNTEFIISSLMLERTLKNVTIIDLLSV